MKFVHFFSLAILVPCIIQAQHIENSLTKITFNKTRKTVAEWIRDDRRNDFGKTKIITITSQPDNQFKIQTASTVADLDPEDFIKIASGYAFYCRNIKKKGDIEYGAIVIDPTQHHFDQKRAGLVHQLLINQYIRRQLAKDNTFVQLD